MRPTMKLKFPAPSTILMFIVMVTVVPFPNSGGFRGKVFMIFAAYLLFLMFVNRGPIRWMHILWVGGFYVLSVISQKWSYYPEGGGVVLGNIMSSMLLSWSMGEYVYQGKKSIDQLCEIMMIMAALLLVNFALNATQVKGRYSLGTNANTVGVSAAYLFGFLFYKAKAENWRKITPNLLSVAMIIVTLFTGSRKALLMIGLFVAAYMFMWMPERNLKKILGRIVGLVVSAAVLWFLLMKVDVLYESVGNRLETLFLYWFRGEEVDASAISRDNMSTIAIEIFKQHPILGNGHNAVKYLSRYQTYSHNNYLEILCSVGIVGFALYYFPLFYFTVQAFILWRKRVSGAILPLMVLVLELLNGIGHVSYYSFHIHIFMGLAIGYIYSAKAGVDKIGRKASTFLIWRGKGE